MGYVGVAMVYEAKLEPIYILDECLAFLASGRDPTVSSLAALNEAEFSYLVSA